MHFEKYLHRLLDCILTADPTLGPALINKVDLADEHMSIWVVLQDTPPVALLVPRASPTEEQIIIFHLSIPMGYVKFAELFCTAMGVVKDIFIITLPHRVNAINFFL